LPADHGRWRRSERQTRVPIGSPPQAESVRPGEPL